MKITSKYDKELTPKQYAEELLMDEIHNTVQEWYTKEREHFGHKLTEKEQAAINDQMNKIGNRLAKVLHYEVDFTEIFKGE